MKKQKKLTLAVAVLAAGLVSSASASTHGVATYRDTIRPHGHARSDAVYNAAVNTCYAASGESRTALHDTDAFKSCMLSRGWRFQYASVVRDPPSVAEKAVAQRSYTGPSVSVTIGGSYDEDPTPSDNSAQQAAEQTQDAINSSIAAASGQ